MEDREGLCGKFILIKVRNVRYGVIFKIIYIGNEINVVFFIWVLKC